MRGHTLTRVEENNGSQAAQLCLVHLHVLHFRYQLRQDSAGDPTHRSTGVKSGRHRKLPFGVHYHVRMSHLRYQQGSERTGALKRTEARKPCRVCYE